MDKFLLVEIRAALKANRYSMRSFAILNGYSPYTVRCVLRRIQDTKRLPKGEIGVGIVEKIKQETGYDIRQKLASIV